MSYMEIGDQLYELHLAVTQAKGTLPKLMALSACLAACERFLSSENPSQHYLIFNEAAFLLGERVADGVMWDWWQEQARVADAPMRQEQLRIALFEMVPEPPIIWSDLYRLWDFWFDPAARWAIFSAYWWFPRRLPAHLARYSAHRRHKLPIPRFSHEEFCDWLQSAKQLARTLQQTTSTLLFCCWLQNDVPRHASSFSLICRSISSWLA